jgi:hypothetical protein
VSVARAAVNCALWGQSSLCPRSQENSFNIFSDKVRHDVNAALIFEKKTKSVETCNYYADLEWKAARRDKCRGAVRALMESCVTTVTQQTGTRSDQARCTEGACVNTDAIPAGAVSCQQGVSKW